MKMVQEGCNLLPMNHPRYYRIIKSFFNKTGVPMILIPFNENEPIVNTQEALNFFKNKYGCNSFRKSYY